MKTAAVMLPPGAGFVLLRITSQNYSEKELRMGKRPEGSNKNSHEAKATVHFPMLSEVGTGPGLAGCGLQP